MAKQVTTRPATPGKAASSGGRRPPSISTYIQESRAELRKVTWPTWEETRALTIAVIAMTLAIALFLGAVDQILNSLVNWLLTGIK